MIRRTHVQGKANRDLSSISRQGQLALRPFRAPEPSSDKKPVARSPERVSCCRSFADIDILPRTVVQPKLPLGPADSNLEGADQAQRESSSDLDRIPEERKDAPPNRTGMPDRLKWGIESLSGLDLSGVRVHYRSPKPAQIDALAFAQGRDIHVAPGQERHLPHEAWHLVQQAQGRVRPTMQLRGGVTINDDGGLEREADAIGEKVLRMRHCEDASSISGTEMMIAQKTSQTKSPFKFASQFSGMHFGAIDGCIQLLSNEENEKLNDYFLLWEKIFRREGFGMEWMNSNRLRVFNEAQRKNSLDYAMEYLDNNFGNWFERLLKRPSTASPMTASPIAISSRHIPAPRADEKSSEMSEDERSDVSEGEMGEFTFQEEMSEAERMRLLEQLNQPSQGLAAPLGGPRITVAPPELQKIPKGAVHSRQVNGHNNDCVLAAFRTVKSGVDDNSLMNSMTSTEDGIATVAQVYNMNSISSDELVTRLNRGQRAFINAHALSGKSYHAYAALGIDVTTGKVIAWDTDSTQQNIKLVPIDLIWKIYA